MFKILITCLICISLSACILEIKPRAYEIAEEKCINNEGVKKLKIETFPVSIQVICNNEATFNISSSY